jgi:hypothetical protein
LHTCKQIGVLLEQLCHIREREDRLYLVSAAKDTEVEAGDNATADAMGSDGNIPDGNNLHTQIMGTQAAFGTQLPLASRAHARDDEPQVIGVKPLEPVRASNTQRTEIRPGAAKTDSETHHLLLNLLEEAGLSKSLTTSAPGFAQSDLDKQRSDATPAEHDSPKVASEWSPQQSIRPGPEADNGDATSSVPDRGEKRVKKVREISLEPTMAAEDIQIEEHDIQESLIEDVSETMPECTWMKGFVFNRETLTVPKAQRDMLTRDASWLKPPPGVQPFQNGNMPQLILSACHRIADERADTDIEEESDPDPSAETVDPSPESPLQKTQNDEPATTQDDDDTDGEMSWEESPESPERPPKAHQELPPDSSLEKSASHSEHDSASQPTSKGKQPRNSSAVDISDDDKSDGPSSSPPDLTGSDDEMDMEESVPQALGEDLAQRTQTSSASDKLPGFVSLRSPVVVQVKETPYREGKDAPDTVGGRVSNATQSSSGEPKHTSSTSIIHSTYDTPSLSDLADLEIVENPKDSPSNSHGKNAGAKQREVEVPSSVAQNLNGDESGDMDMSDNIIEAQDPKKEPELDTAMQQQLQHKLGNGKKPTSTSHVTPRSAQLPPKNDSVEPSLAVPHLASQATKRKLISSPTKSKRRQSKRREIKIVGFRDDAPSAVDPMAAFRRDREESLRRLREQRNSSTSFDSRRELISRLTAEQDSDAMEVDEDVKEEKREPSPSMSPGHRDLYDDPSPGKAPSAGTPASPPPTTNIQSSGCLRNTHTRGPVPISAQPPPSTPEIADQDGDMSVFQSFKAAYPEYGGDETHFRNQCTQMYQLEQEDKMVPKWQWDDFIIRNRTDYRQYVVDCIGEGENPEPYHRFYKNEIRDTLYKKGIIANTKTLQRALEELDAAPTRTEKPRQTAQPIQKPKPVRRSLPGAFNQPQKPTHDRVNNTHSRPRHSLPINPRLQAPSPHRPTPSSSASSSRHQPRPSNPTNRVPSTSQSAHRSSINTDPTDTADTGDTSTGIPDKYRNFYFGYQRLTSFTGSTKVSSTPGKK